MTVSGDYFEYTSMAGDRWDLLAYRYYGDANKQTVILEANRALWSDTLAVPPAILPRGLKLRIPVITEDAADESQLPPWKRANPSYGA